MEKPNEKEKVSATTVSNDAYFEIIQSRKKLASSLQETLTASFANIPVSSFPQVPGGKEIPADITIANVVKVLSESNIFSAPVTNPDKENSNNWRERYLEIIDYSAIILWVLESAQLAVVLSASSTTAVVIGAGAVGAAVAGGMAANKGVGKDAPTTAS